MVELPLALVVFFVTHSGPAQPRVRRWLIDRIGRNGYLAAYSALSLAAVTWLIVAKLRAPYLELWPPRPWQEAVAAGLMVPACILLVAALIVPNPLSIGRPGAPGQRRVAPVLALTRHPLLWALALWALAHTVANGDVAAVILFTPLAAFCVVFTKIVDSRRRATNGEGATKDDEGRRPSAVKAPTNDNDRWLAMVVDTSNVPLAAIVAGRARFPRDRTMLISAVGGIALFFALLALHLPVLGTYPLWLLR